MEAKDCSACFPLIFEGFFFFFILHSSYLLCKHRRSQQRHLTVVGAECLKSMLIKSDLELDESLPAELTDQTFCTRLSGSLRAPNSTLGCV